MEPGRHLAIKPIDSQPRDVNVGEKPLDLVFPSDSDLLECGVNLDQQGRVILGSHKFVILSKRLVRNKVNSHFNE